MGFNGCKCNGRNRVNKSAKTWRNRALLPTRRSRSAATARPVSIHHEMEREAATTLAESAPLAVANAGLTATFRFAQGVLRRAKLLCFQVKPGVLSGRNRELAGPLADIRDDIAPFAAQ